jgi:hypothetical protein
MAAQEEQKASHTEVMESRVDQSKEQEHQSSREHGAANFCAGSLLAQA